MSEGNPNRVGRRDLLRGGVLVGAGALLSGCSQVIRRYTAPEVPASVMLPTGDVEQIARLLHRTTFGPLPGEIARVKALGVEAYVEEQLHPGDEESLLLNLRLRGIEALHEDAMDLQNFKESEVLEQLQQATILRAVYSRHQLRERMVDFWSNHFNIYAHEGHHTFYKPADEFGVVRPHVLGKFPELLNASAHSPAMLFYLNNDANRSGVPNENYARELMELHTLGVHGGYTQKDVQEVARCFTGWTVEGRFARRRGTFRFDASRHDDGAKTVLGTRIAPGGGEKDAQQVLALLSQHPATARFISRKISRYFLGDGEDKFTHKLAKIYQQTGGDLKAMLRPLLLSDELRDSPPILKRPFDYLISSLRALNADTDGGRGVQEHLRHMGQPLYQWPMPDGYPDRTGAWTGSLLARWNFALALAAGDVEGTSLDLPKLLQATPEARQAQALREIVFAQHSPSPAPHFQRALNEMKSARKALRPGVEATHVITLTENAALLVAAPEFQWR
ncbi:hypothetical protein IAD21_00219 [Abditibacteriota bacterium]|nr:hypothetical protein IAD21_00219 [Abditibacteriota bacterium]